MNPELKPFVDSLGLTYTATFIPQSQSRNAGEKNPSLNWRVSIVGSTGPLSRNSPRIVTDYTQGIGHLPETEAYLFKRYGNRNSLARDAYYKNVAHDGKYGAVLRDRPLPPPALLDVLYSLVSDSDADENSFEDWCSNYGYDTDSRWAEATYNACREIGTKLRRMLGADNLARLRELFQDY